jgi:hypothetical protein
LSNLSLRDSVEHSLNNLRNIILCDDVRNETGNKLSLMGVIAGDIIVGEIPATISFALYMQYFANPDESGKVSIQLRLFQGDTEIVKGRFEGDISEDKMLNFVLPRALVTFEKETTFRIHANINDGEEREILSRKIIHGTVS